MTQEIQIVPDRCGKCAACRRLEHVKTSVLRCSAPAGPGIGDDQRELWNDQLRANPCEWDINYTALEAIIVAARAAARAYPGKYGGRYVARLPVGSDRRTAYLLLPTDDPEPYRESAFDIVAVVYPDRVAPIGSAGNWLRPDGTIDRNFLYDRERRQ